MPADTITRPAPPRITAAMLEAVSFARTAVIVQNEDGAVFTLPQLNAVQLNDPTMVVLADHVEVMDHVANAGGRFSAAAKQLTAAFRSQHARGLL